MIRPLCLTLALSFAAGDVLAQTAPDASAKKKARRAAPSDEGAPAAAPSAAASAAPAPPAQGASAAPKTPVSNPATANPATASGNPAATGFDQEEFRRQVMEEVRKELQKTRDEVKQETSWVEQDSQARVQDSEAVDQLKQRVNLFQPHGYVRARPEFFYNMNLGRGPDASGHSLFPGPFIGAAQYVNPGQFGIPGVANGLPGVGTGNNSQSDVNFRFRFEPTLQVSEDLAIHFQADVLDNVLLGSDPVTEAYMDPFTPLSVLASRRGEGVVNVKRVWGEVNLQLGELVFGRMGYNWGLGILHNDGNCLDCDFGDTYDRIAFTPREFKGHHFTAMFDILDKGQTTTGAKGELGRSVDLDTLDDGYRFAIEVTKVDSPEEIKRKLDANQWVVNYGLVGDVRIQAWDTPFQSGIPNDPRANVTRRGARFYQPDAFLSLKRHKWRLDAELAFNLGTVDSHQSADFDPLIVDPVVAAQLTQPVTFFQSGGALQSDMAFLPADALLVGVEAGAASGDRGAYGFGAREWRSGSGHPQTNVPGQPSFNAAGPGDFDGSHLDFSNLGNSHGHIDNFVFNRAFTVDTILFRNLITAITSSWYLKPSVRYRPSGRKTGGGDDTGFEFGVSAMYAQAWYAENTPGLEKPLGLEFDANISYETADHFHAGLTYAAFIPFGGLRNFQTMQYGSVAHAVRAIMAIPF